MPYVNDSALDAALAWIRTNGTTLHICSSEPATYAQIASRELAVATVTVGASQNGDASGRKATIPAVVGDAVDTSGTATHWALSNASSILVATGALSSSVLLDDSGTYNFNAVDIEIADFVAE